MINDKLKKKFDTLLELVDNEFELIPIDEEETSSSELVISPQHPHQVPAVTNTEVTTFDNTIIEVDFNKTRNTLYELLNTGSTAINNLAEFIADEGSARGFEVLGNLLKIQSELAKDLLKIHKDQIELQKLNLSSEEGKTSKESTTTNNINQAVIFTGTTDQALQALKKKNIPTE